VTHKWWILTIKKSVTEVELILAKLLGRERVKSSRYRNECRTLERTHGANGVVTVEIAGDIKAHTSQKFVQGEDVGPTSTQV
jgi:hypothetical protein